MPDNDSNFDNDILFAIDKNGRIFSVPEIEGEIAHFQPYSRLNKKMNNKLGDLYPNDTSSFLPQKVAKLGCINIYPLLVFDPIGTGFMVVFPTNKTENQLESLKSLYDVLEKKEGISFYKKTIEKHETVYFEELEKGIEKLKIFVEEELKKIRENLDKNEGR